ncbi:hypothetical protein BC834DRAFT_834561, partial [Gloeopeniophorella convolvens]
SAPLLNHDILHLLRELKSDHIIRAHAPRNASERKAMRQLHPPQNNPDHQAQSIEHVSTTQGTAVQYLSVDYQPTRMQTQEGIQRLTRGLAPFRLTKAERLQIVNLTTVEPIVEELEDRRSERMEEVLGFVRSSLSAPTAPPTGLSAPVPLEIIAETRLEDHGADGLG